MGFAEEREDGAKSAACVAIAIGSFGGSVEEERTLRSVIVLWPMK